MKYGRYALVQHDNSDRIYLFSSEIDGLEKGDDVVCKTKYGEKTGVVKLMLVTNDESIEIFCKACGASLPLAPVLRKYVKPIITSIDEIPQHLIDQIRYEYRDKLISAISHPFNN